MKSQLTLVFLFLSLLTQAQFSDVKPTEFDGHYFFQIKSDNNTRAIIFLHGGMSNPAFQNHPSTQKLEFLLEGNSSFIDSALGNDFDLLIPIKDDKLNWVDNHEYSFQYLNQYFASKPQYTSLYISGFSDGGTGSYRMFYAHPDRFDGLMVFNGYPQKSNYNKDVDYTSVKDKKVLFLSTENDALIPYEFLLTEYCKQKKTNPNTYLYVAKGGHSFGAYRSNEIHEVFGILRSKNDNSKTEAIHGFIRNDEVIHFYQFRKKIYRKYTYGKAYLEENGRQRKLHDK